MGPQPDMSQAALNLNLLRDHARKELVSALDNVGGKKALVLDPKLSGPLTLVIQTAVLKEHGVENLYHLSAAAVETECTKVVYLVRAQVALMKLIAGHIREDDQLGLQRQYHLLLSPREAVSCEKALEAEGVLKRLTISEYSMDLIPFDEDLLSMELETCCREALVDGDTSSVYPIARSLVKLQALYGTIPSIKGKGKMAGMVLDMMLRLQKEQLPQGLAIAHAGPPEIDTLVILDRQVDMVSPLCTQLTYEGLLDEFLGIHNGNVELDPTVMGSGPGARKLKVPLNSGDKLFRELRDLNFGVVGQMLREKAAAMKQDYSDVTLADRQAQSVSELRDFVKRLNALPEMTRHTNLAQHLSTFTRRPSFLARLSIEQTIVEGKSMDAVLDYIEELIGRQEPLPSILRLLCLLSLTSNGLPRKSFDSIRRELLQSYGYEHLSTVSNLERAGLLIRQETKSQWPLLKKTLRLVVEDCDDANPNDIAYTYSGYAPLSIRLVTSAVKGGWKSIDEALRQLPGTTFERRQTAGPSLDNRPSRLSNQGTEMGQSHAPSDVRRSVVLVFFIGGVTFAEIAALRWLSAQESMRTDFIVATTKLVNGTTMLRSMMDL